MERDTEYMRSTPIRAAAQQKSGSKVEITVDATGRQSMSPQRLPEHRDEVNLPFHKKSCNDLSLSLIVRGISCRLKDSGARLHLSMTRQVAVR